MNTRLQILKLLQENKNRYLSGQEIGDKLSVSRNTVWKSIEQLRNDGYTIESKVRIGYKLIGGMNTLSASEIIPLLKHKCKLEIFDSIGSTNEYAKAEEISHTPLIVISNKQTSGKGRLGRSFNSPAGTGLYMTLALRPDFTLEKSLFVTMAAAVAVSKSLDKIANTNSKIKWVNDVFYKGKKVCGILTEAESSFEANQIEKLIIGIGINCFPQEVPDELKHIVGFASDTKNSFSRNQLAAEIINSLLDYLKNLDIEDFFNDYRRRCFILGKQIEIKNNYKDQKGIKARAIDIDKSGGLIVEYLEGIKNRQIETLIAGEISIVAEEF